MIAVRKDADKGPERPDTCPDRCHEVRGGGERREETRSGGSPRWVAPARRGHWRPQVIRGDWAGAPGAGLRGSARLQWAWQEHRPEANPGAIAVAQALLPAQP
jgi:hypothetical protein